MKHVLITLIFTVFSLHSHAALQFNIQNSDIIAEVDGVPITERSVDIILAQVKRSHPQTTRTALLKGLIENRVIAAYATSHFGEDALTEQSQKRVGFPTEVTLQTQLVNTLRQAYHKSIEQSIAVLPGQTLDSSIRYKASLADKPLNDLVALKNPLEYRLTSTQEQQAKGTVILRYQFPNSKETSVSLWDIYQRQNVQGRIAIHNRDDDFFQQQIRRHLLQAYVLYWAYHESPLTGNDMESLKQLLADKHTKADYLRLQGLRVDIHDTNPALKALANTVTAEEITSYYNTHKEDFKTIEKVRAQHLRLNSQQTADEVYSLIRKGLDFNEAVRRFSTASSKNSPIPGDLGWIKKGDKQRSWLKGITFVQPVGKPSRPFRSPQMKGKPIYWEIVKVREKTLGYQPADSEGVRYQASRAIAKDKAVQQFKKAKSDMMKAARIDLNPQLVNLDVFKRTQNTVSFQQTNQHSHAH